jgi:hypothetical protein
MKTIQPVTRRVVSYLARRLELLPEALTTLGQRLRQNIAEIVGEHVGDVIRERVLALLDRNTPQQHELAYHDPPDQEVEPETEDQTFWDTNRKPRRSAVEVTLSPICPQNRQAQEKKHPRLVPQVLLFLDFGFDLFGQRRSWGTRIRR